MAERKASNKQYFESISRKGGGGDMKLKMKMLKCSKFDDLERKNMRLNKPPLYETVERSENSPVTVKEASDEPSQVTVNTRTSFDKSRSAKNLNNLNSSKSSTKTFVRTSSLKLVIVPAVKESSGSELYSKRNVHRGTCSSTQKETRFPKTLELDPGGTDAEGISVMNVCSYRYCSLNGHRHEALPSRKSFSTRRRSLKTEKKMKALVEKGKRENDRGQPVLSSDPSELNIKPLIEEEGADDFFVEIYAEYEQITEKEGCDSRSEEGKDEKENFQYDVVECVNNELVDDDEREGVDQSSELSKEEMDVIIDVLGVYRT
ncbi:hypothetical protein J5N97_014338 [Dioscorea zingiberensis]|uniref:Uncharacterized protein n=1 Tax=Dioscorea zingiberensis TaxID=325984 RepID=A0A9D5CTS7_9LILI|nr:hypothetical protein J5N97_014338 [Dioscorea zingiberensis]